MLRDTGSDGIADIRKIELRQRNLHGIPIRGREIFLADIKTIYAADILADGRVGERRVVGARLPDGGQHRNRTLAFSPEGGLFNRRALLHARALPRAGRRRADRIASSASMTREESINGPSKGGSRIY